MAGSRDEAPELRLRMFELYEQAGRPTYRVLKEHADRLGLILPTSTTGDLLKGHRRPKWDTVRTFVMSCREHARQRKVGGPQEAFDLVNWQDVYNRPLGPSGAILVTRARGRGRVDLYIENPDAIDTDQEAYSPARSVS